MLNQTATVDAFVRLGGRLNSTDEKLRLAVTKTYVANNWLTQDNYWLALGHWQLELVADKLLPFVKGYAFTQTPHRVGVIMAGNIPLVGFHDLLCVILSGNIAVIKPSSDDKYVMLLLVDWLQEIEPKLADRIEVVERVNSIDAVIATGSNNSFRYFEHYFKGIPSLLRKNRKSMAILDGTESDEDLSCLADDVFRYFGLGCRNVSFIYLPVGMNITIILDAFMKFKELANHNKYANNYTYHRALLLMNTEQHLDTGFALPKERENLHAPLACLHYAYYQNREQIQTFIEKNDSDIQCIVGNYSKVDTIAYGQSQEPELQDFADNVDTMIFLASL